MWLNSFSGTSHNYSVLFRNFVIFWGTSSFFQFWWTPEKLQVRKWLEFALEYFSLLYCLLFVLLASKIPRGQLDDPAPKTRIMVIQVATVADLLETACDAKVSQTMNSTWLVLLFSDILTKLIWIKLNFGCCFCLWQEGLHHHWFNLWHAISVVDADLVSVFAINQRNQRRPKFLLKILA